MKKLQLYRSVVLRDEQKDLLFSSKETMRPPGNVPYIVDNLWEWQRPLTFPCRRFSAYASPTPELALQSGPKNGKVFRLEFLDLPKIAQLKGYADSKYHPECRTLRKKLFNLLNDAAGAWWPDLDPQAKGQAGQLWMPCLRKEEIDSIVAKTPALQTIREHLASMVTYWHDVALLDLDIDHLPDATGEIFFETKEGYRLVPAQ